MMNRKFKKVAKTKGGVPKKYVSGAKNPKAREAEIKRTSALYKAGKLTAAMMNKIAKQRKLKDLSGDGKITRKDVLIGRGVIKKKKGGMAKGSREGSVIDTPVSFAKGGKLDIKKAIKKPGALRKSLGVKKGEKIPSHDQWRRIGPPHF